MRIEVLSVVLGIFLAPPKFEAQAIDWNTSNSWRIYLIENGSGLRLTVDSLRSYKSRPLDSDSVRYYLSKSEIWPKKKSSLWMGQFVATYRTSMRSKPHKIDISFYGGFIYDETSRRYYQLPPDLANNWMQMVNREYMKFYE